MERSREAKDPGLAALKSAAGDRVLVIGHEGALNVALRDAGADVDRVEASQLDRHGLERKATYQAVVCIDALPWMRNLDRALDDVHRALVSGGRLLIQCDHAARTGAVSETVLKSLGQRRVPAEAACPWLQRTPEGLRGTIERHGFAVASFRTRPVDAPANLLAALAIAASTSEVLPPGAGPGFLDELGQALRRLTEPGRDTSLLGLTRTECLAVAR